MKINSQSGFSLIEIIIVVTVIGILSAIAIPSVRKSLTLAEDRTTVATMKTLATAQVNYYSLNKTYAGLSELNNSQFGGLGSVVSGEMNRGKFTIRMDTTTNTPEQLRSNFVIEATRPAEDGVPFLLRVDQTGNVVQVLP